MCQLADIGPGPSGRRHAMHRGGRATCACSRRIDELSYRNGDLVPAVDAEEGSDPHKDAAPLFPRPEGSIALAAAPHLAMSHHPGVAGSLTTTMWTDLSFGNPFGHDTFSQKVASL
jgi:hypothetical protein